ncbi:MAG TPA: hypothetical protein VGM29_10360 [Polyangiaceae bacterium]|jgi:hypothetical protein
MNTNTTTPTVTLTAYNLGGDADEAFFLDWIAYVGAKIDAACGFVVSVDSFRFTESQASDRVTGATDGQEETIREALRELWDAGCADNFLVGEAGEGGEGASE